MKYNEFVRHVQNKARLGTQEEAARAIRATLETLGEYLVADEASHLADQLPEKIGYHLRQGDTTDRFTLDEFLERVAQRDSGDLAQAAHHAQAVISVMGEAVTVQDMKEARDLLPHEFAPLFELGSEE